MSADIYVVEKYLPVFVMLVIATFFAVGGLIFGSLVRPKVYYLEKLKPYECGNEPSGLPWQRIAIRYIPIAILFVVFDVEIAFVYLWGVSFSQISAMGLFGMTVFITLIFIGFLYDLKKGYLDWTQF
ncbi:MAG: NADH-quinone oxidoreductase subunit A [Caldimicrobium sp.]|nr:NADH-quinone oxidoreductase subunit A [Caldimicrobium sp.]MCX7873403.1 NADH-quinone oxidoreductase subunit A [Caldimicrobium sp.]MDW8094381.1 NADH-quinone oxidoreductase subunit A [Caldimicrobium sp.]